jgi:1-phosphofructokinase family hexose kinase
VIYTVTLNPSLDRTLTVPRIMYDEMVRATASRVDWGGKGLNVSRTLQSLGAESIAMGFAGGATGQMLERGLRDLGITTELLPLSAETRTNTVVIDSATGRYVKVNEPGPTAQPDEQEALLDRIRDCLRRRESGGDLWVLSGSLPPGLPDGFYAHLVELVQTSGARALLDASGESLRLGCAAAPFLVKPNVAEALGFAGEARLSGPESWSEGDALTDAQARSLARPFLESGIELVALSLGAGGLLLTSAERAVRATPPKVHVRNPVGAGDALLAAVAWALARHIALEEVARLGVAVGTAAAMSEGVAVVTGAEVEALYEQVTVHAVE